MRKKITLTIDSDVYDDLEELPRRVSVSEFVNFMLKGYIETFKKGNILSKEELDKTVQKMGGEEFRERLRTTFPTVDKLAAFLTWIKEVGTAGAGKEVKK